MRTVVLLAGVVLSLVGCNGTTGGQPSTTSPLAPTQVPTPMPLINVDDMMGLYPQQTVFVATTDHVSAVTLLNHDIRYRIATNGVAQVSSDSAGQWLYLLDADSPGSVGSHRLRVFDVATGSERALLAGISGIAENGRELATASDGRVLVLKSEAAHVWVDAYEGITLRPVGPVMDSRGCGDRLVTNGSRVAIVCLSTGEVALDDLRGSHAEMDGPLANLVATTMADDGTLYLATADEHLALVAAGSIKQVNVTWPSEWSGSVLADGLAYVQGGATTLIAERTDDGVWLRLFPTSSTAQRKSLRLAGVPQGGVLTMWPFAYYTVDRSVRHVDLTSGLLETMAEVGAGAVPGAVVNG